MSKILILYGTDDGQNRKVAEHIAAVLRDGVHQVELLAGNQASEDFTLDGYDAVIVGTSVHMDVHQISVRKLVKAHHEAFSRLPSAYFCVCLTAYGTTPRDRKQVQKYIDDFTKYTGWKPGKTDAFPGALRYRQYNAIKRFTAKLLARKIGADTDTSREYEYTNWNAVSRFGEEFLESMKTTLT